MMRVRKIQQLIPGLAKIAGGVSAEQGSGGFDDEIALLIER
jgi:hypothetical protein